MITEVHEAIKVGAIFGDNKKKNSNPFGLFGTAQNILSGKLLTSGRKGLGKR